MRTGGGGAGAAGGTSFAAGSGGDQNFNNTTGLPDAGPLVLQPPPDAGAAPITGGIEPVLLDECGAGNPANVDATQLSTLRANRQRGDAAPAQWGAFVASERGSPSPGA